MRKSPAPEVWAASTWVVGTTGSTGSVSSGSAAALSATAAAERVGV